MHLSPGILSFLLCLSFPLDVSPASFLRPHLSVLVQRQKTNKKNHLLQISSLNYMVSLWPATLKNHYISHRPLFIHTVILMEKHFDFGENYRSTSICQVSWKWLSGQTEIQTLKRLSVFPLGMLKEYYGPRTEFHQTMQWQCDQHYR